MGAILRKLSPCSDDIEKDEDGKPIQTLKPAWKRWGTATAAIGLASAIAGLLLVVRSRVIRKITLLPGKDQILVQSAAHWRAQKGTTVRPASCEWGQGRGVFECRG